MPLTADDQAKYRSLYFSTAKPYIRELQSAMKEFTSGKVEDEKLTTAHRSAHSLTSQSKMMGFEKISSVTSLLEHILRAKIENELELHEELVKAMENAVTKVSEAVELLEAGEAEIDLEAERAALSTISMIEV